MYLNTQMNHNEHTHKKTIPLTQRKIYTEAKQTM